jgi:hypothetical protein
MLLMAVAGGMAYDYHNYISSVATNHGSFATVLSDTIRVFKNDFRLIKPKKFGFVASKSDEEVEMSNIIPNTRVSACVIIKNKTSIAESMVNDYL